MSEQAMKKYNIIDLFAGAGGLSYGFLQTKRFTVKAAFEINPDAQQTYIRNHGIDKNSMYSDVSDALTDEARYKFGEVDVIIGGPPCQGFSNANRQKNHAVSLNNSLVKKFVKAVLHLNPKAFLMENVSMLKSKVHRFYVSNEDIDEIKKYSIPTEDSQIQLLDQEYLFDSVFDFISDYNLIEKSIWTQNDYKALNVIFKNRNNEEKLKKALIKYERTLRAFAEKLISCDGDNYIIQQGRLTGKALLNYFENKITESLCERITISIMLQRMLSRMKEIKDNKIAVEKFSIDNGLIAQVKSMYVLDYITHILGSGYNAYTIDKGVLSATSFGAPQKRMRFVILGAKTNITNKIELPKGTIKKENYRTVHDAIWDLEKIPSMTSIGKALKGVLIGPPPTEISELGKSLRDSAVLYNHISTQTTKLAHERFKAIKQGYNFHSLPEHLKKNYSDSKRTQNSIYLRLAYDQPSGTVVNVRKSMWIHPSIDRALSIREAARLQTFPDSFIFYGSKDSQYQQIGNAVPPVLARALAETLYEYLDKITQNKTFMQKYEETPRTLRRKRNQRQGFMGGAAL